MTKQTEALRMAIGDLVLQKMISGNDVPVSRCTITATEIQACKEALAETQEAMIIKQENGMVLKLGYDELPNGTAFYTTPPSREWVGLSDEEIYETVGDGVSDIALAIEAKLREKNELFGNSR